MGEHLKSVTAGPNQNQGLGVKLNGILFMFKTLKNVREANLMA